MLVLASQSPRRKQLLEMMGLEFQTIVADVDESMDSTIDIQDEIMRISRSKALAVQAKCTQEDIIIAADTMVCIDGKRLGKPKNAEDAFAMLRQLSGREHHVISGLSVVQGQRVESAVEITALHFRPLCDAEIAAYIATGEPMDKAGAYGIQGKAAMFAQKMCGDYYNVMGLPVCRLTAMLRGFGVKLLDC